MNKNPKPWRTYEEVAQYLLNGFAVHFGLGHVQGKQVVQGKSGVNWEIEAKGVADNGEAFVIVQCRRHTTRSVGACGKSACAMRPVRSGSTTGEASDAVYVLHRFQEKSQKTSKADIDWAAKRCRDLAGELGR